MNANPKFLSATAHVDEAAVQPLPNSRKVYVEGSRPDIRVPMREITQSDTPASFGAEKNPPIFVYDTSGPYTDPQAKIDIRNGLPALRAKWIDERGDTEELAGPTSRYGVERLNDPQTGRTAFQPQAKAASRQGGHERDRRCTTRARASSRPKWNSSPSARTSAAANISNRSRRPARRAPSSPN